MRSSEIYPREVAEEDKENGEKMTLEKKQRSLSRNEETHENLH